MNCLGLGPGHLFVQRQRDFQLKFEVFTAPSSSNSATAWYFIDCIVSQCFKGKEDRIVGKENNIQSLNIQLEKIKET